MNTPRSRIVPALAVLMLAVSLAAPAGTLAAAKPLPAKPAMVMPWIEDDYTRAVSEAKARKLPIFVESWAPW